jgi:hypothetical protein
VEDFQTAFVERRKDVDALDEAKRRRAAMHFGGVTIECLLKYIICTSLPRNAKGEWEWKTDSNNPGHTVYNPGHNYEAALRCYNRLRFRVQQFPQVVKWLSDVENMGCHFIDMRYLGDEPDENKYKQWKDSYQRLLIWLQKQATQL